MEAVGAARLMTTLTSTSVYFALIQTASAFPFFLLALPPGSIGDIFDRRKLILGTEIWMFVIATVLAVVTFTGSMKPRVLLLLTPALSFGQTRLNGADFLFQESGAASVDEVAPG